MGNLIFSLFIIFLFLISLLSELLKRKRQKPPTPMRTETVPEEKILPEQKISVEKKPLLTTRKKEMRMVKKLETAPLEIEELPTGWEIDSDKLREGIILMEILSPPRARRRWHLF